MPMRKYKKVTEAAPGKCWIDGCDANAERSLPISYYNSYLVSSGMKLKDEAARSKSGRFGACDVHYQNLKRASRKDKETERARRGF
jgi:hypothetical protein